MTREVRPLTVERTATFQTWLDDLRDQKAVDRIEKRIGRVALGNLGDHRAVGEGVVELKFDFGPGYRVYFVRRGDTVVLLLCGGDKSSQADDIARAKAMAAGPA